MLWDVEVKVVTLKCNGCGEIFNHRMYLNLSDLPFEQARPHYCEKCSTKDHTSFSEKTNEDT